VRRTESAPLRTSAGRVAGLGLAMLTIVASMMLWAQSSKLTSKPGLRVPSDVSWTEDTIALASGGSVVRGLILSRRCDRCHGGEGFSSRPTTPNLAGLDRLSFWKQLQDFRSGKRPSFIMQQVLQFVLPESDPDLAAYYSMLPTSSDPQDVREFPSAAPAAGHTTIAARLVSLGDGRRGIPPCQACHGPVAFVRGAPPLRAQNTGYILEQLEAFADASRANDINISMRSISAALTDEERRALAEYYGAGFGMNSAGATAAP